MMPASHMPSPISSSSSSGTGGRLVATPGLELVSVGVEADARGGVARVVLRQRFRNPHAVPLVVTYAFPLPADAAVSAFAFTVGERRIVGEVDRREAARERFEQALLEGKTSALLEQDRSSLFTQEIGNVPPGAEVGVEIALDQKLAWRDEGAWEWRFPLASAPRYLGVGGRVADANRVTVDVAEAKLAVRASLALAVRDGLRAGRHPESPSHALASHPRDGAQAVSLDAADGAPLDRDLVVRWAVAAPTAGVSVDVARPRAGAPHGDAAYAVVTIVPPTPEARPARVARDVVVLLDTSGSMGGEPLAQARRVVSAVIATMGDDDRLELVEFSSAPRRWKREAVAASAQNRAAALTWLASLTASGGTEMREGILEALRPLRKESQRQVILVTDGHIGFEQEVVAAIAQRLPAGACLHAVGVGSAVNRSLTGPAARAGRGLELIVGLGEDAERAAKEIVVRTSAPLVVDVTVEGSALLGCAPQKLPALFAGAPVLAAAKVRPEGGELVVRGRTRDGIWEERVHVPPCTEGSGAPAAIALFGRETVEDLELERASNAGGERARARALDASIERIGLEFQIATRLTSWLAIDEEPSVDPALPTRRVRVPQELPHGMSAEGLGLRASAAMPPPGMFLGRALMSAAPAGPPAMRGRAAAPAPMARAPKPKGEGAIRQAMAKLSRFVSGPADEPEPPAEMAEAIVPRSDRVRGRLTRRKDATLVVEIDLEGTPLAWRAGADVEVTWADGVQTRAAVGEGTTRARLVGGHDTIRLVLTLDPGDVARLDAPVIITVGAGIFRVFIDL